MGLRRFIAVAATCTMVLLSVVTAAFATETYSGWKKVAEIGGVEYWGRTSIEDSSHNMYCRAYLYSGYLSGSTWVPINLYEGYMFVGVAIKRSDGSTLSYATAQNLNLTSSVMKSVWTPGKLNVYYRALGYGYAYNWMTGSYEGDYLISSPILEYSNTPLLTDGLALDGAIVPGCTIEKRHVIAETGETYGELTSFDNLPDWILVQATNGLEGYVDADDFWTPMPINPADAVSNFSVQRVRSIPVYAEPGGGKVIGQFDMYYGGAGE